MKKYHKTLKEARQALKESRNPSLQIYKMPEGTRKVGWYAVCTDLEYLNTY